MLNELKQEMLAGKKVYLFEVISFLLFGVFVMIGDMIPVIATEPMLIAYITIIWLLTNAVVIVVYALYSFIEIVRKEKPLYSSLGRVILFKVIFFTFWFALSSILFMNTTGMSIPIISLGLTFMVLVATREVVPSKKLHVVAGVMWFGVFFSIFYMLYPIACIGLNAIIPSVAIVTSAISIAFFALAFFIFFKVIKKVAVVYQ